MKSKKRKIFEAKTKRFLGITKLIDLTIPEQKWIKLCKGHYRNEYKEISTGDWIDTLKPMFEEIYGWSPEEHYTDFLYCIFKKLLSIHFKISDDKSGHHHQLISVFTESFSKRMTWHQDLPIERAIEELCGLIQCNTVRENGVSRYLLPVTKQQYVNSEK